MSTLSYRSALAPRHPFPLLLAVLAVALVALPAAASLILTSPNETSGTGLGAVNTVLTIHETPPEDRIHSGCVAWNGAADVVGPAACPAGIDGGDEQSQTQTRTLAEVGLSSAFNLRVVYNSNEPQSSPEVDDITIDDLVLTIYETDGSVCFESGPFVPQTFLDTFSGVGSSGFVFRLDAQQAAQAQPCFDDAQNRVGLASTLSDADQGPETFFIADAGALAPPGADLSLTKSDTPDPVAVGATLTYTLTATNDGPNAATGVTVVDTLPSSVVFVSAMVTTGDGSCTVDGRVVTCELGDLPPDASEVITIEVTTTSAGVITNNAVVAGDQPDPDTADNDASEDTTVGAGAGEEVNLSVLKADSPDPVVIGSTLTYTLTVRNAGPDTATGVTLTDQLPPSVTLVSATPNDETGDGTDSCTSSGSTVSCDLGDLAANETETVTIEVTPTASGLINNFVQVSADEPDSNLGNNSDEEGTTVVSQPPPDQVDLALTKIDLTDPVSVDSDFTYRLTVDNLGTTGATGVTLVDNLPPSVTFVSASAGCTHSGAATGGTVTCEVGSLAAGASVFVDITVTAPSSPTTLTNSAIVSADQPDVAPADNSDSEQTAVEDGMTPEPDLANLSITKSDSPDPAAVGGTITYTLTVFNAGPDGATGVIVTDNLPALVSFVSASLGCTHDGAATGGTVTCDLGSIAAGGGDTVEIVVTAEAAGTADDFAAVSSDEQDVDMSDNTTTERTTIGTPPGAPVADLRLAKSDSPDPVAVGALLTYSLTVTNDGPDAATNVRLDDQLPATVACVEASSPDGACACPADALGGTVTCDLGTLAAGASAIVSIQVRPSESGTLVNTAVASADQAEPVVVDNLAEVETAVQEIQVLPIPTLGEWSLALLGLLLAAGGLWHLRRG